MKQVRIVALTLASTLLVHFPGKAATPGGRPFPTANAAAQALVDAVKKESMSEILAVLGPSAKELIDTKDPAADRKMRRDFLKRVSESMKLVPYTREPHAMTLVAGKDTWPMPIPIVQRGGKWYFDALQGKEEVLSRRIGADEIAAIEVCRGYVEAQDDYGERNRIGGAPHFAEKIISTPGRHDGLYWKAEAGEDESPLGELVAKAIEEGYTNKNEPFHGYYFRILKAQGPSASGGEMSYLEDGEMTKGFALIAWPAEYRIMTFIVDKTGIVYEKDLGAKTGELAPAITAYDPDRTWRPVSNWGTKP